MANTLTGLVPTLYEALDIVSRELIGMIPAVTRDSSIARAAKGQTVDSFVVPAVTASDITPGVTAPNDGDQVITAIPITITKSRYVPVRWNGEEQKGLNNNGPGARSILTNQFTQGFRTLVNEVETDCVNAAYKAASRAWGTAATAPFGTANSLTDSAGALQILDDNGAPISDRQLVLGSAAMSNLRGVQTLLFKVNESGTEDLLRNGVIGRLEGFDLHNSSGVKVVTKGTGASYTSDTAGYALGSTSIALINGTGTVLAGDVVTFAGDSNKYIVTTGVAAPGTIVLALPGLKVALATSAVAMTVGGSFTPNLAFAKSAIVLATRAPAVPLNMNGQPMDMAEDRMIITDPYSGISFEVSLYLQYRQIKYEIGLAWGEAVVKPNNVAILLG